jgi:hypothetical protein
MGTTTTIIDMISEACGGTITATELAMRIADPASASDADPYALRFYSDVPLRLQLDFIEEMGVDLVSAILVARDFANLAGWEMPLGKLDLDRIVKDRYGLKYLPVDAEYVDHYRDFLERSVPEQDEIMKTLDGPEYELFQSFQVSQALYEAPELKADGIITPEKVSANLSHYGWKL